MLSGLQVSGQGDLANWYVPEPGGGSIGGMDLAVDARRLIVAMEHTTRDIGQRLVAQCDYPLTAAGCVSLVVTDLAVIEVTPGILLREVAPGTTIDQVIATPNAPLIVPEEVPEMSFGAIG